MMIQIRRIAVAVVGLLSFVLLPLFGQGAQGIQFPDPAFEAVIRYAANVPSGPVLPSHLVNVTVLPAPPPRDLFKRAIDDDDLQP